MADLLDLASETAEFHLQTAINNARKPVNKLPYTSFCHNCSESVGKEKLFCDKDCSDDYHKRVSRTA